MSTLKVDTLTASDGTSPVTLTKQSAAKAWVNFNGVTFGSRDSFNVSSLDDDGSGQYDINFASSFSDGDYCAASTTSGGGAVCVPYDDYTQLSGTYNIGIRRVDTSNFTDASRVHYSMNGDLA